SETEEDVRGIAELSARVAAAAGGRLRVTASVSTFSPKPHTPFQWAGQLSLEETRARQALLRHQLGRRKIEFRWHDARLSLLEGIFARGDRRLADVLETAQRRGARFDGWSEHCRLEVWNAAMAAHGLEPRFYLRRPPRGRRRRGRVGDEGLARHPRARRAAPRGAAPAPPSTHGGSASGARRMRGRGRPRRDLRRPARACGPAGGRRSRRPRAWPR